MRDSILSVLVLAGCSDYDITGPREAHDPPAPADSAEPEPEPSEDPDIKVSPNPIDFGYQLRDCPADPIVVTIENVGLADLKIGSIELAGDAKSKFGLTVPANLPKLAYGETTTFTVDFLPTSLAAYEITTEIKSNDPDSGFLSVPTLGTGADSNYYEESFEQDYAETVDVLWVIDNSGSMSESISKLRRDFQDFMSVFTTLGLDYHLGVVSTDMDNPAQSGKLLGSPNYIDSSYADPVGWMDDTANLGDGGSGDEKGLEAARTALSDPLASGANAGFLRRDSAISIVVLSDENDSSSIDAAGFTSWFEGLRSDIALTTFNGIVGDRGLFGCLENGIEASGGDEYIDVIDATDGVFRSICSADFKDAARNIGQASAGMTVVFPLAKTPSNVSKIEVEVDGTPVDYDALTGFSYDSTRNAIEFHGDSVPDPGTSVYVTYPIATACE